MKTIEAINKLVLFVAVIMVTLHLISVGMNLAEGDNIRALIDGGLTLLWGGILAINYFDKAQDAHLYKQLYKEQDRFIHHMFESLEDIMELANKAEKAQEARQNKKARKAKQNDAAKKNTTKE